MKKFVVLTILLFLCFLPFSKVFADDITGIQLEKEVRAMAELGIIKGYSEGVYGPHDKVTRGQFAAFIARALELPDGPHVYTDVSKNAKLAKKINAAAAAKIVNGYNATTFKPDEYISRAQIALMINNALSYLNVPAKNAEITFKDQSSFSPAAQVAISNMVGYKITSGFKEGNGYVFKPAQTATRAEAAAFIYRLLQVLPKEDTYRVANLDSDGNLSYLPSRFTTFEEANKAIQDTATQVIIKDYKILKMGSGIAFSTPSNSNDTTLYSKTPLTDANVYGGISKSNEMEYVSSDGDTVTVKVAGQTVYVNHNQVTLIPYQSISERTYYTKDVDGKLLLRKYDHMNKKYVSISTVGKAPSALAIGGIYYSWDGATFTDENGKRIGTYHQYFNMLPVRTRTNYTAAELDKVIMRNLEERESYYYKANPSQFPQYENATNKSKLIGLGSKLKEIESEHNLNALLLLGIAISESDFGMSPDAQRLNNLFGLGAHDERVGDSDSFASPEDSIFHFVSKMNQDYLPLRGAYAPGGIGKDAIYANGGALGNKARGINVRYATDPYWGQNIAGHMYLLDQALGGKDFVNNSNSYKLFETNSRTVTHRGAGVSIKSEYYHYPGEGYPVAAVGQEGEWTKILSDLGNSYAYILSQLITPLPIAK